MSFNITKQYEKTINKTDILPYQLHIWSWFLGYHMNFAAKFCNPFRLDQHPDCYLEPVNGIVRMRDWADHYCHGNNYHGKHILDFIQLRYNCNFKRALQIAYYEALEPNIHLELKPYVAPKSRTSPFKIESQRRNWNKYDKRFWNGSTGITSSQLEQEQCFPSKKYWYTDKRGIFKQVTPKAETYVNHINDKKKLYQPKNRLFLTNFTQMEIGGFKQFNSSKDLFVTKNLKSYMCLSNIDKNSRYTPNEGIYLTEHHINLWDTMFDRIFFLFDNDLAGLLASQKLVDQWKQVTGNNKAQQLSFSITGTYKDMYNNTKPVSDPFDLCKYKDLTYLDKQLNYELQNI